MSNRKVEAVYGTTDEHTWARTPSRPPMAPEPALHILGAIIIYLTLAPPIAVILWRIATHPW